MLHTLDLCIFMLLLVHNHVLKISEHVTVYYVKMSDNITLLVSQGIATSVSPKFVLEQTKQAH